MSIEKVQEMDRRRDRDIVFYGFLVSVFGLAQNGKFEAQFPGWLDSWEFEQNKSLSEQHGHRFIKLPSGEMVYCLREVDRDHTNKIYGVTSDGVLSVYYLDVIFKNEKTDFVGSDVSADEVDSAHAYQIIASVRDRIQFNKG